MNPFLKENLEFSLKGKRILLGITGSIAAFKSCDIVRYLRSCGAEVRVVLTQGAENFVTPTTLETLSGAPVLNGFWDLHRATLSHGTHHIDTARWADLILVAPSTANFIAKIANGFADDLLSTEILAFRGPLLVAPAMNPTMFSHPAVQENLSRLKARGTSLLGPGRGNTACGEEGLGRMLEPDEIVEKVAWALSAPSSGKRVLITLGPTRSPMDPVRFITNRSSGLMGASLCWATLQKGYAVTAICGSVDCPLPKEVEVIRVQTTSEMQNAVLAKWPHADIFISTAAVLDWEIHHPSKTKLKKSQGMPRIDFIQTPDILATVSQQKSKAQFVLGFAAETENPVEQGMEKLRQKGCDAIFANDVSRSDQGFESSLNGGWWLSLPDEVRTLPTCTKPELARKLLSLIEEQTASTTVHRPSEVHPPFEPPGDGI